jgi:phosphate transport system substrate-binding protein
MKLSHLSVTALAVAGALVSTGAQAQTREQVMVVGSSTVFPYSQAAAEQFANKSGMTAPVVESTGTGGGFQIFCGGVGIEFADVTGASRAITSSEQELCKTNGVTDITEALIGYDGLSIAHSQQGPDLDLTEQQIFMALAAELPDGKGGFMANPYKNWNEIDASLPAAPITVFGPPPTSGTRDAFVELAMHDGCNAFPEMAALEDTDEDKWNEVCSRMRQDGPFIEAGENDNLIVQRLNADTNALGIFGYSFLYENSDTLKGVAINGVQPGFETIADFSYPIARPIYFYIKNAHRGVIPGLNEFLTEYVSDDALAADGYLPERGLTPLNDEARAKVQADVASATSAM